MLCYLTTSTNSTILLYVWHVRQAWLKNIGSKVKGRENKGRENKIHIFRALGDIRHSCQAHEAIQKEVASLFVEVSEHKKFLKYFKTTWLANNKICKFLCS